MRQIKKKTLSFKVNALNIELNVSDRVKVESVKNVDNININALEDIKKNEYILNVFPDLKNDLTEKMGLDLLLNVASDINHKTESDNKKFEKIFSKKKILITYILIFLCVIMYGVTVLMGDSNLVYITLGANNKILVKNGQIFRLITYAFLHGSLIHLITNMYSLWIIGNQVENNLGKVRMIIIYFVSALCGGMLSCIFNDGISVGASGAIFGLMGALVYFGMHYRLYLHDALKNKLIPVILVNLITLSRLISAILLPILYFKNGVTSLCILIPFLFVTDLIDGKLSRYFKVETFLGSILDAVSDKVFAFVLLGLLSYYYKSIIIVILFEFVIFVLNTLAFTDNKNIQSSMVGKVKTFILDTSIVIMYLFIGMPLYSKYLSSGFLTKLIEIEKPINYVLIGIMIGMEILTLTDYKKKSSKQTSYEKIKFKELKSTKEIIKLAKDNNTTVTVYLTSILIKSIGNTMSRKDKRKPVVVTIPVNLRKYFKSNTARNFFNTITVQYKFNDDNDDLESIINEISSQFKDKLTKENLDNQMNAIVCSRLERL